MTDKSDAVPSSLPQDGIRGLEPGNLIAAPLARLFGDSVNLGLTRFGSSLAETAGYTRGSVTRAPALSGISASH